MKVIVLVSGKEPSKNNSLTFKLQQWFHMQHPRDDTEDAL